MGEGVVQGRGCLGEEEKHRKTIEEYDTNLGIIQGQKGLFGKGGVLGEGVLRRGCLGEGVLGEEEKHRKTIGVRIWHQHGYNPRPEEGV